MGFGRQWEEWRVGSGVQRGCSVTEETPLHGPPGGIDYRAELSAPDDFVRLFRSSGWDEALDVPANRLAEALPHAWYAVCAYRGAELVGTGLVLSDGVLHALIVDVIVVPELRGHGIGTEIMRMLIARCAEAGVLQVQLFSARGRRSFYERLGFVARPDDGPGMELGDFR